jgi:hypothetical protein
MGRMMLRRVALCSACAVASMSCADGGKNPVAPESRRAPTSTSSYTLLGAGEASGAKVTVGAIDAALVVRGTVCAAPIPGIVGDIRGHFVLTPSGNFHVVCHAETTQDLPDQGAEFTPLDFCEVTLPPELGLIEVGPSRGHVVVTPSGQVHLVCHGRVEVGDAT